MILGLIPARGSSKGIPKKNIKPFCGKSLIQYAIEVGRKCGFVDRVVVSSDDDEILDIAWGNKAEFIERPSKLAQDDTPMMPVIQHAVQEIGKDTYYTDGERVKAVVLLDPTNPLRTVEDMEGAWRLFQEPNTDCVVSGCEAEYHPDFNMGYEIMSGYFRLWGTPVMEPGSRQLCLPLYQIDTTVWIYSRKAINEGRRIPEKTRLYLVPPERSASIDTPLDWFVAEFLYRRNDVKNKSKKNR